MNENPTLTFLGIGSSMARQYLNTNALVEIGNYNLLIDCGHTIVQGLNRIDYTVRDIDGIFVTHIHPDHTGGLPLIGFESYFDDETDRPELFVPESLQDRLWSDSLQGAMHVTAGKNLSLGPIRWTIFFE